MKNHLKYILIFCYLRVGNTDSVLAWYRNDVNKSRIQTRAALE